MSGLHTQIHRFHCLSGRRSQSSSQPPCACRHHWPISICWFRSVWMRRRTDTVLNVFLLTLQKWNVQREQCNLRLFRHSHNKLALSFSMFRSPYTHAHTISPVEYILPLDLPIHFPFENRFWEEEDEEEAEQQHWRRRRKSEDDDVDKIFRRCPPVHTT